MSLIKNVSKWFWLLLLPPLIFSIWSIVMLNEVRGYREDVKVNVITISRLTTLELSVQQMGKVLNFEGDTTLAQSYWDSLMVKLDNRINRIDWQSKKTPGLDSSRLAIQQSVATADTLLWPFLHPSRQPDPIFRQAAFVNEATKANYLITSAKFKARRALGILSLNLNNKWESVNILAIVACICSFMLGLALIVSRAKTQRLHEVEQELLISRNYFRRVFQQAGIGIVMVDFKSSQLLHANPAFCELVGYTENELSQKSFRDLFPSEDRTRRLLWLDGIANQKKSHYRSEARLISNKDDTIWTSLSVALLFDAAQKPEYYLVIAEDISERMHFQEALKESQERYRLLAESSNDMISRQDGDGQFKYVSPASLPLLGYEVEELTGMNVRATVHPDDWEHVGNYWRQVVKGKERDNLVFRAIKRDGKIVWLETTARQLLQADGNATGETIAISRNITKRKEAEKALALVHDELESRVVERTARLEILNVSLREEIEQRVETEKLLEQTLGEKDLLLKEIFHRVKNNLQVIASLLRLQENDSEEETLRNALRESRIRLNAMAMLHENLYQSENLSTVDLQQYLGSLVTSLKRSYPNLKLPPVQFETQIEPIGIEIDTAIPLGLIINELVSNALKYAFITDDEPSESPKITLRFEKDPLGYQYRLMVADNGKGFPSDFDPMTSETFGLKLVNLLSRQLNGKLTIEGNNGVCFSLILPESPYRERIYGAAENTHR